MRSRSMTILICFIMTRFLVLLVSAAEVQLVHFGSTVTLSCNVSYLYDTTWLKQNADLTPTVVLCASLREGRPTPGCQLSPRHSVSLVNRSLALRITGVENGDLGLYFCIASVNMHVVVGKATRLCVGEDLLPVSRGFCEKGGNISDGPLQGSSWFVFYHWYIAAVCSGLFIMVLAVCVTHWRTKPRK